ncbi:MAG: hypothetical protein IJI84_02785 [Clostridia bacterium]|nr:hypothetical protein [Clostridia bacterium]
MSDEKAIWKDVVAVAKFALSCLGIVAASYTFVCNIGFKNEKTEKLANANKLKGLR